MKEDKGEAGGKAGVMEELVSLSFVLLMFGFSFLLFVFYTFLIVKFFCF